MAEMTEKELLAIIKKAARRRRTGLNLSRKWIKELPAEIGKLTNLKGLDLSFNQLTSVPAELGQLKNLTGLNLAENP